MEVIWSLDPKYQVYYYINQAREVQDGFFQEIRAIILPFFDPRGWYLPDYGLFDDKEFLERLSKSASIRNFIQEDSELCRIVEKVFDKYPSESEINEKKSFLETIWNQLFVFLETVFPITSKVTKLYIIPAKFGTGGAFFYEETNEGEVELYVTHRLDMSNVALIKTIVSTFIANYPEDGKVTRSSWTIQQGIRDFFFNNTKLRDLIPNFEPKSTLEFLAEYKAELALESAKYFAKLGIR